MERLNGVLIEDVERDVSKAQLRASELEEAVLREEHLEAQALKIAANKLEQVLLWDLF